MEGKLNKGIVRYSCIPVYSKASYVSQLLDQFVYGEMYEVYWKHETQPFYYVYNTHNKVMGWIIEGHHHPISDEFFNEKIAIDRRIVSSLFGILTLKNDKFQLCMGAVLPITGTELFPFDGDIDFSGESVNIGRRRDIEYMLSCARRYLNTPFLNGGRTPYGIDSSGLICTLYRLIGREISRNLIEMETFGTFISSLNESKPGDLVFFADHAFQIYHVGILLDKSTIIHVDYSVKIDKISEEGINAQNSDDITHKVFSIKRLVNK